MFNAEPLLQRHLDRWIRLLGLGGWRISWEISDMPIAHDEPIALSDYKVKRNGARVAHIKFERLHLTSDRKVEDAVIHELLHLLDHGIGNDAHKLIYRLEGRLRLVRKRASR